MTPPAYFLSDAHITLLDHARESQRRHYLFEFLDTIRGSGGSLFLVGDFFDFWFEYKHVIPKRYFDVISQLHSLRNNGIEIHFILGNHDYWTNDFLSSTLGLHVYTTTANLEYDGLQLHLTHGDGLLAADTGYRLMRKVLRSRWMVFLYRWLHPDLGISLAQSASRLSRKYNPPDGFEEAKFQELTRYAQHYWDQGCDIVVMGHYHLNRLYTSPEGKMFLCLGDWISQHTYGKLDQGNLTLESWST